MSNDGPRFQARYEGEGYFATVRDKATSRRGEHYIVCACDELEIAKIIASALNRRLMQMADDQGNGDGY